MLPCSTLPINVLKVFFKRFVRIVSVSKTTKLAMTRFHKISSLLSPFGKASSSQIPSQKSIVQMASNSKIPLLDHMFPFAKQSNDGFIIQSIMLLIIVAALRATLPQTKTNGLS